MSGPAPTISRSPDPADPTFDEACCLIRRCAVCGSKNAPFGDNLSLRNGELGTWFCRQYAPEIAAPTTEKEHGRARRTGFARAGRPLRYLRQDHRRGVGAVRRGHDRVPGMGAE